ncbi:MULTISPECIES: ferredoxin [unclassified Streptomyces]|uniref:ferredoxin n=1 Tax=unclassified Streptomyces TaxID=2593676 RepID=UPI00225C0E6A|nr:MULTISPECIES: ferredoxin [unclassified Streptomyces]MCX5142113.1 ferredoxin [Streptomyces sp. NBC_00338]WRZ66568.1 ferredoxin [Streptomyces sp. NBC_01257]WSU60560.1 ferredoxin [Streptomyces sp. NBC_01104]
MRDETETGIAIGIDRDVCIGAGQCALVAPKVFTQDDDGLSELLPASEDDLAGPLVGEAARACPVQAITVT